MACLAHLDSVSACMTFNACFFKYHKKYTLLFILELVNAIVEEGFKHNDRLENTVSWCDKNVFFV